MFSPESMKGCMKWSFTSIMRRGEQRLVPAFPAFESLFRIYLWWVQFVEFLFPAYFLIEKCLSWISLLVIFALGAQHVWRERHFPGSFLHPINTVNQAFHMSFPYPNQCTPCFVFAVSCMKSEYAHFLSGPRNNLIIADIFAFFLLDLYILSYYFVSFLYKRIMISLA